MFKPSVLEDFFARNMPATKALIENLWNSDRIELIEVLNEYLRMMGSDAYGWSYIHNLRELAKTVPHEYTNPWKVM